MEKVHKKECAHLKIQTHERMKKEISASDKSLDNGVKIGRVKSLRILKPLSAMKKTTMTK